MTSTPVKNQRIIANAGSGKTHRLVTRYIELLAHGVPPERIVALTFTRKAAGEFLERIIERLAAAASEEQLAAALSREIGRVDFGSAEALAILRTMVAMLSRLSLGTMDAFFGRIVRAFPFECGLAGEIRILGDGETGVARRQVLASLLERHGREAFDELRDIVREQARNNESRAVIGILDELIKSLHELYLETPPGVVWGDPKTIWGGPPPLAMDPGLTERINEWEEIVYSGHPEMDEVSRGKWDEAFRLLRTLRRGGDVPGGAMDFAMKLIDPVKKPNRPGEIIVRAGRKEFSFDAALEDGARELGLGILALDIDARLARSRALHGLLARFEPEYEALVRGTGRMSFSDITGLLAGGDRWSGRAVRGALRRAMDYRLDGAFDHWLVDEFQDTSRLQWDAMSDLVDEVVQGESGERSFFYVGDTKQAIYAWRGGDSRLFDEICEHYNHGGSERIDTSETLARSYRSSPEIISAVNRIFGNLQAWADPLGLPEETVRRWKASWHDHEAVRTEPGCFSWTRTDGVEEFVADWIDERNPTARGWTCAVLVRSNDRVAQLTAALRTKGLRVAAEGRQHPCVDNPLGAALLAGFRAAAHPGDSFAPGHMRLTPMRDLLEQGGEAFRRETLTAVVRRGFAGVSREWIDRCGLASDDFLRGRAGSFLKAAEDFDAAGGGGFDDFEDFATAFQSSEMPDSGAIRVMTIHAAKGLDFDLVVLADADGRKLASPRDNAPVHLHRTGGGRVVWGMDLPPRDICGLDEVLGHACEEAVSEGCYENLCASYVASTRARRGLHIVSEPLKEKTTAGSFNRLLHLTFGFQNFESGDADWHRAGKGRPAAEAGAIPEFFPDTETVLATPAIRPSLAPAGGIQIDALIRRSESAVRGSDVHRMLAEIEWISPGVRLPAQLAGFFETDTAAQIFRRPAGDITLWREQAFQVVVDGRLVSGIFDRVVLRGDKAELFEFKTGGGDLLARHGDQLRIYRRALAELTGARQIEARIVSVPSGEVIVI